MLRSLVRKVLAIDTSEAAAKRSNVREITYGISLCPKPYMLSLCTDVPSYNRCEFIRGLAALCSLKPEEVNRCQQGSV